MLFLKKVTFLVIIVLSLAFSEIQKPQEATYDALYQKFLEYYKTGDILNSEKILISISESDMGLNRYQNISLYNNLGVVSLMLGQYDKALEYNFKAESYIVKDDLNSREIADIYNNRGYILHIKKSYDQSIEYLEKSISIYMKLGKGDSNLINSLEAANINISIALLETRKYLLALKYLEKNVELNSKEKFSYLSFTYLNMAKTYVKLGNSKRAEEFYIKSTQSFIREYNENYYRLAEVYFYYGQFLRSQGKTEEALEAHKKALFICLKNYGKKHTLVSL